MAILSSLSSRSAISTAPIRKIRISHPPPRQTERDGGRTYQVAALLQLLATFFEHVLGGVAAVGAGLLVVCGGEGVCEGEGQEGEEGEEGRREVHLHLVVVDRLRLQCVLGRYMGIWVGWGMTGVSGWIYGLRCILRRGNDVVQTCLYLVCIISLTLRSRRNTFVGGCAGYTREGSRRRASIVG